MSHQRYPRAVDLAQMAHCSVCGETNPITDGGGDTTCCSRRECPGMGPEAQDVCCQALQDRVDHEAAYGTPASPVSGSPQARATPVRSTRIDETRGLQAVSGDANLVSHGGREAPTTTDPKEPTMALSTAAATSAVCRNLFKDGPNSFEPVGYRFGKNRETYEEMAKAHLRDQSRLSDSTIDGADWDEVFATFVEGKYDAPPAPAPAPADAPEAPAAPAAPEAPAATGWDGDHYQGYAVMAADGGRVWHLSPRNDEAVCSAKVDAYVGLEGAVKLSGICAKCSRYLDKHGAYVPYAERVAAAPAAAPKAARQALGASSAIGWDLLYDKPKAGAEVGRRYVDGKPEFALICKAHGHAHRLARLSDEGSVRKAGGWCPTCSK